MVVSLDVENVNVIVFHAILVRLYLDFNTHPAGHCVNFSGKKITAPHPQAGRKVPVRL